MQLDEIAVASEVAVESPEPEDLRMLNVPLKWHSAEQTLVLERATQDQSVDGIRGEVAEGVKDVEIEKTDELLAEPTESLQLRARSEPDPQLQQVVEEKKAIISILSDEHFPSDPDKNAWFTPGLPNPITKLMKSIQQGGIQGTRSPRTRAKRAREKRARWETEQLKEREETFCVKMKQGFEKCSEHGRKRDEWRSFSRLQISVESQRSRGEETRAEEQRRRQAEWKSAAEADQPRRYELQLREQLLAQVEARRREEAMRQLQQARPYNSWGAQPLPRLNIAPSLQGQQAPSLLGQPAPLNRRDPVDDTRTILENLVGMPAEIREAVLRRTNRDQPH
ncbi:hypothetical protein TSAR_014151 [Trichomalopsis sarcophagae]|uniref:Uncharacterized protein n=1 Tax=Trichomalopsis sarcophagae TaxID=543379 RepID=A0A232EDE4_9HYME|nr:hypothetical protein TSAR_014151 [Trichomalopsis sarcophagae]